MIGPLVSIALFLSGALLFMLQPMIGKVILPMFGGAPQVWTTSLAAFQLMLLVSALYVHATTTWLDPRKQAWLHAVLLLAPLGFIPIRILHGLETPSDLHPVSSILLVLLASVGIPFIIIAATAPLLQSWLNRTAYGLFAAGGTIALIAYGTIIDPKVGLDTQSIAWSIGYGILAVLTIACIVSIRRELPSTAPTKKTGEPSIPWKTRLRWIALAAIPSSLLLSVTNHITTTIAPAPLLWIIPLAIYLLTFVLAFSPRTKSARVLAQYAFPVLVFVPLVTMLSRTAEPPLFMLFHLIVFAIAATMLHGELATSRPGAKRLSEFYVWVALGCAVGGLFNVIAPVLFSTTFEYPLGLILACMMIPARSLIRFGIALAAVALVAVYPSAFGAVAGRERSFYGVYRIVELPYYKTLFRGSAIVGAQSHDLQQRCTPLSYYYPDGPLGNVFASFSRGMIPRTNVGIIGLGTGSIGAYWLKGQAWTFYEQDPEVERIARNPLYFSQVSDCVPNARVLLGDARNSLAKQPDHVHDLIIVDGFISEVAPVHLFTREAMDLYVRKLAPKGVLVFRIPNEYLNLRPQLARLARDEHLVAYLRDDREIVQTEQNQGKAPSEWVAMARSDADLGPLPRHPLWGKFPPDIAGAAWTDNHSNVLEALQLK